MAKINRYDGNLVPFAINATGTNRTIFGSVAQSDDLTANIDGGSWKLGWEIVGPSDKPTVEDFSGATFTNAQISAYLHQMGVAEWNDKQEYQIGSIANRAGVLYSCKTADHVSVTPPESDPANWDSASPADLLNTVRIDVASATTVDLTANAPDTRHINITGSNSISSFTVAAGQCYFVRFDSSLVIIDGAALVTQYGSNIATAPGDTCIVRSTASNVVEVLCYTNATARREEILPVGTYVSGTYTAPNGHSWSDYEEIEIVTTYGASDPNLIVSASGLVTKEIIAIYPTSWSCTISDVQYSRVLAINSTQITISRTGDDAIRQIIGKLKQGVL